MIIKDILTPQKMHEELKKLNLTQIAQKYGSSKQYMTQLYAEYKASYPALFPEKTVTREWLEEALKSKSIFSICSETGLSYHRIRNLIREYGLEKDTVTARFDEKEIRRMYVELWYSDKEIADQYGCSASLVKKFRYNHGIFKTDRLPLAKRLTKPAAEYLVDELHLSLDEISEVFNSTKLEAKKILSTYSICTTDENIDDIGRNKLISDIRAYILSHFVE